MKLTTLSAAVLLTLATTANATILSDLTGDPLHTEVDNGDQVYQLTDFGGLDDATAFSLYRDTSNPTIDAFGIVGSDGLGGLTHLEIFDSTHPIPTSATLSWLTTTNVVTVVNSGSSAIIDDQLFGFYLGLTTGETFYSVNNLNPGGIDVSVSFDVNTSGHPNLFGSNAVLGFDINNDSSFTDWVVGTSDIAGYPGQIRITPPPTTMPEPGSLALMGLGMVGAAWGLRREKKLATKKRGK